MTSATIRLIEAVERLNMSGEIGDGMVATLHELATLARLEQSRAMAALRAINVADTVSVTPAPNDDLRAALEWYAERVADCRKITPEGDNARQALDLDGGKRARAALKEKHRG